MKYFRDLQQDIYPANAIGRMVHCAPTETRHYATYEVHLAEGEKCRIDTNEAGKLIRANFRYFAAFAGCVVLREKKNDTSNDPFRRTAVLGWAVDEEGSLHPLTGEGVVENGGWLVLTPDGKISDQFGGTFSSEEHYLRCCEEE